MAKLKQLSLALLMLVFVATGCSKDDPVIPNESEIITTFIYTLTPQGGGSAVEIKFQDLDGDGGSAPVYTAGDLKANTVYNGSITILNEIENPAVDITEEIEGEGDEHQFFFDSDIDGVGVVYNDEDENGMPVGLSSVLTSGEPGTGTLTIILRHQPDKYGEGVDSGDITNAGGETDLEIAFDINVI